MSIVFDLLEIGQEYDRPEIAELWGYRGFQAISRGVVTPAGTPHIILFVTRTKQSALTQYLDYIDDNRLHWEGEEKHGSDKRITQARSNGDHIHLFYREIHHSRFTYYGEIHLSDYELREDAPSRFIFSIPAIGAASNPLDDIGEEVTELRVPETTERKTILNSRVGQGIFRDRVVRLWQSCSVTGITNLALLRASHIKPWRDSTNRERLDPYNGLLLQPVLDHLFDSGLITFDDTGTIMISRALAPDDVKLLNIDQSWRLRILPEQTTRFLHFHRESVYRG